MPGLAGRCRQRELDHANPVHHVAGQKQKFPGHEPTALAIDRDVNPAFDALNRDLAGHLARRKGLAGQQDQPDDFRIL